MEIPERYLKCLFKNNDFATRYTVDCIYLSAIQKGSVLQPLRLLTSSQLSSLLLFYNLISIRIGLLQIYIHDELIRQLGTAGRQTIETIDMFLDNVGDRMLPQITFIAQSLETLGTIHREALGKSFAASSLEAIRVKRGYQWMQQ